MSTRRGWLANGKWIACEDTTCTPENEQKKTGPQRQFSKHSYINEISCGGECNWD
jgi:hypothetical protein